MAERLSAVIVYHRPDVDFLRLQARSFRQYANRSLFAKIIIIENFDHKDRALPWHDRRSPAQLRDAILDDYGDLAGIVEFSASQELCDLPRTTGWRTQQILKLAAADLVHTDRYVTLDAKNHLIRTLYIQDVVAEDGRAFLGFRAYQKHPLRDFLDKTLRYFGIDIRDVIASFPQPITPFMFDAQIVRELKNFVASKEKMPFADAFVRNDFTEFFAYCAYVLSMKGGFDRYYVQKQCGPVLWPHINDPISVGKLLGKAERGESPFFALHRLALAGMPREAKRSVAEFWVRRHLFSDPADAIRFLRLQARRLRLDAYAARLRKAAKQVHQASAFKGPSTPKAGAREL